MAKPHNMFGLLLPCSALFCFALLCCAVSSRCTCGCGTGAQHSKSARPMASTQVSSLSNPAACQCNLCVDFTALCHPSLCMFCYHRLLVVSSHTAYHVALFVLSCASLIIRAVLYEYHLHITLPLAPALLPPILAHHPTDAVYLARWAATPVSKESIIDNLPKVNSKRARVAECLTRIAPVGFISWTDTCLHGFA